jgi:hypothetical protein
MLNVEKEKLMYDLDNIVLWLLESIKVFNKLLMDIWNQIMWNTSISFEIKSAEAKTQKSWFLEFILRADSDWSHSIDRLRTFTYDISLMISEITKNNHPQFLVHDNIFDVDQNSLIESLNFLWELEAKNNFQYITTLNNDKIYDKDDDSKLNIDIKSNTIIELTKSNRFFNFDYKEE